MVEDILKETEDRFKKTIEVTVSLFSKVRTSRANPQLLSDVKVECYDSMFPLGQLSTISVPDAKTIIIKPFDMSIISEIEKAINKANIGLQPIVTKNIIRINIPPLTEERRLELVKLVKRDAERQRVAIRNIRREQKEKIDKLEKDKALSEDEKRRILSKLEELTDKYIEEINELTNKKEKEIMEG